MSPPGRKRILFIAEAVTLAHVARPFVLAQSLDPQRYDVHFAGADRYAFVFQENTLHRWEIQSISSGYFLRALSRGARLYSYATLQSYVSDDLQLIEKVDPDLIVGDFRLSLAVSAAVAKVPYAAIANAYWSPHAPGQHFPLPELEMSRFLGYSLSNAIFQTCRPLVFSFHASPLNRLRKAYGLPKLKDLCDAYTHADYTLYADLPDFFPTINLPVNHRFIGPIDWSPKVPLPDWWDGLPHGWPVIYVNLGSSGAAKLLPRIAEALSPLPVTVILVTAARWGTPSLPENIKLCEYISGNDAARRAELVICNGGSPAVYQALSHGVPVIGIASNMDQRLSMQAVERSGCGITIRSEAASVGAIRTAVKKIGSDSVYKENAALIRQKLSRIDARREFNSFISGL